MAPINIPEPDYVYGIREEGAEDVWPDEDHELKINGLWRRASQDPEVLRGYLKAEGRGRTLIRRTFAPAEVVPEPLPPIGTIAIAKARSPLYGDLGTTLVVRVDRATDMPWVIASGVNGITHGGAGLRLADVEVLKVVFTPSDLSA